VSIRRKLFLAFVAAAALPLLAMGVLARLYLQRARVDVEQKFVQHAREAGRALSDRARDRTEILKAAIRRFGHDVFMPPEPKIVVPMLRVMPQGWLETAEGKAEEERLKKLPRKVAVHQIAVEEDLNARVARFRAAHPQLLHMKVVSDGQTVYDDLHGEDFQPDPELKDEEERDLVYVGDDGRRLLEWATQKGLTRVLVEVDPLAMLEPMTVAGVRAFYLTNDGKAYHTPAVKKQLEEELPLAAFAGEIPSGGESARVKAGGEAWRIYSLVSAERDTSDYGGNARLVAVAPEALIEGPLLRFRAEVAAAGLLSLLVAMGLSYFLSGRFSESVENLKRGVDALSRGEFAHLEKSSGDELGGELVESMNRMASALAERTRREEIEGWRRLVRVLSHEINNTLGPVKSVAQTVRDQLAPRVSGEIGEDLRDAFKLIVDRVDSLSSFISGYAVLAKLPPPERAAADLNEIVRSAVAMLKAQTTVEEAYDPEVGTPLVDQQQLERVAINLVKNAVEAAASTVWVKTAKRGDMVELTVEDDGPGIAAEARPHLFVPYYTTKPGGSGIGLALARQIVLGHGGTIAARDKAGGGTIVVVQLPVGLM
jgi:signal transduction histidine kinase